MTYLTKLEVNEWNPEIFAAAVTHFRHVIGFHRSTNLVETTEIEN
jgi:hypothetical protein